MIFGVPEYTSNWNQTNARETQLDSWNVVCVRSWKMRSKSVQHMHGLYSYTTAYIGSHSQAMVASPHHITMTKRITMLLQTNADNDENTDVQLQYFERSRAEIRFDYFVSVHYKCHFSISPKYPAIISLNAYTKRKKKKRRQQLQQQCMRRWWAWRNRTARERGRKKTKIK